MAVGFTPKHTQELSFDELTQQQCIALINEAVNKMNWQVGHINNNAITAYTDNGIFSQNAEIKIRIESNMLHIQSTSTGSEMMDWGKNKNNVAAFLETFEELKETLEKQELDRKYQELKESIVQQEEGILNQAPAATTEKIGSFLSIFKPALGFFVTPILLDLNILIFILMAVSGVHIIQPDNASLLKWGANFKPMTLNGEWWRLITNCFLHIGIFHLLMNMYALLYIGVLLEPYLGKARFTIAYLLTGVTASISSLWWHDLTISAGASGAVFGMYGVFLAMLTTNLIEKAARKSLLTSIAVFVGYNLVYGMKGGIDNAAHIGGLLGGLVIGYALIPSLKKPEHSSLKFGTLGLLATLILVSSFAVYTRIPNDIGQYELKMKEIISMESQALQIYNLPEDTPNDKTLYEIKEHGIYYWEKSIDLIDSFNKMDLPLEIRTSNKLLREYCLLRMKSYELLYRSISESTDQYKNEIDSFNQQVELKVKELEAFNTKAN